MGLLKAIMGLLTAMKLRISARHLSRVGQVGIAGVVALTLFALALVVRVFIGPLSLGPFDGGLRSSLAKVLPGLTVRFDDAALEWSREEGRLNLVVLGARVLDEYGRIIAQAPEAEIGLAVGPFLKGHIEVQRIALVGVQLTLVHAKDGAVRLGINGSQNQSDVLQRIREAISRSGTGAASLRNFAVNKARLAFYEQETGAFLIAPDANLQITKGSGAPGSPKGSIKANVDANVEISGKPARLVAVLQLPANDGDITGDVSLSGLKLSSLAANARFFSFLEPFDMTTDVTGNFTLAQGTHLRSADFGIGAAGTVTGLGKPLHVKSFRVTGRYDGLTGRLLIDDASLQGIQARAHMTGQGDLAFDAQGSLSTAAISLQLDSMAFDMPSVMGRSVTMARAAIRGNYLATARTLVIDQALVFGGPLSAKFSGRVQLADDKSPEIDVEGTVAALGIRDLMRFWPLQVGDGARRWIDANVSDGRIGPVLVHTHILPGALELPALPENAMAVTFPVTGASITYIHGMTQLTGVNGTAELSGDTFKADIDTASAGPLTVSAGHVVIPNLHLHGASGQIGAHVEGTVPELLALIDEKPLNYPSRFQIRTASAKGTAAADISMRVPMLHDIKVDDVGISIHVSTNNLALALGDHLEVSNGALNFDIDNRALHANGMASLNGSNLGVDWTETFAPKGPISTQLRISGLLQDNALAALGVDAPDYVTGALGVSGELDGYRGKILRGQLKVDLTSAALLIKLLGYSKPAGAPASAQVNLRMDQQGNVRNADFTLAGASLSAKGSVRLAANGNLQALDLPSFKSGTNDDFSLSLARDPEQGLSVTLAGHSFDGENLLTPNAKGSAPQPQEKPKEEHEPYRIGAKLDRVVMREGVVFAPFVLSVSGTGSRPQSLALSAQLSKTAQLSAGEDGGHIRLSAGDAGLLLRGLFGSATIKGGTLALDAALSDPPKSDPQSADYSGKLTISDITAENQPFLMKLFAAGSFTGLATLMGSKGIQLDKVDVPFTLHGDILTVHDARASANALGLTADGYYDLKTDQLRLQGTFTPFYALNGIINDVPGINLLLASRKGEGVFGVTYSASGAANKPDVAVNPLSVLTPGILRRALQGSTPTAPQNQDPQ